MAPREQGAESQRDSDVFIGLHAILDVVHLTGSIPGSFLLAAHQIIDRDFMEHLPKV